MRGNGFHVGGTRIGIIMTPVILDYNKNVLCRRFFAAPVFLNLPRKRCGLKYVQTPLEIDHVRTLISVGILMVDILTLEDQLSSPSGA